MFYELLPLKNCLRFSMLQFLFFGMKIALILSKSVQFRSEFTLIIRQ